MVNRSQAIDIAENRTFSYQQMHAKNHRSWIVNNESSKTNNHLSIINNHCALGTLYIYREPFTNQLLFMQNKANFRKGRMNVSSFLTKDYENEPPFQTIWKQSQTNPIFCRKASRGKKPCNLRGSPPCGNPNRWLKLNLWNLVLNIQNWLFSSLPRGQSS